MKLNLLLHCIKVEDPELFKQILLKPAIVPPYSSDYQLQKRPFLKRLLINLKVIKDKLGLSSIEISLSVPCLNYLGITGYKNGKEVLYIEVVDEYTRLKNLEDVPVGLNALKIRLLNKSDQGLLVVTKIFTWLIYNCLHGILDFRDGN